MPGGAYCMCSDSEGEPVAIKYLDAGFVSFVLSYSVKTGYPTPLIEAMLAVACIRDNADKYGIDKSKICAVGFSAGGHLAGMLATVKDGEAGLLGLACEQVTPDAFILSYPVVAMGEFSHDDTRRTITGGDVSLYDRLSVEKRVDGNTAPAFIWHTFEDNCVSVENSLLLASAYRKVGVPFALHIFEHGGHGMSLADDESNDFGVEQQGLYLVGKWFFLSLDWLKERGFVSTVSLC